VKNKRKREGRNEEGRKRRKKGWDGDKLGGAGELDNGDLGSGIGGSDLGSG
jgi:hypothetical protein